MTPLRQKMIDAMQVRGFSVRTHCSYLSAVTDLARYYHRSPDQLSGEELQAFFVYLAKERELSGASCRLYLNAIRFFYLHVLRSDSFSVSLVVPERAQRIPELLTRAEVGRIVSACANFKHRIVLTTCYGCGLRVSEAVTLKVRHIDGERPELRARVPDGVIHEPLVAEYGWVEQRVRRCARIVVVHADVVVGRVVHRADGAPQPDVAEKTLEASVAVPAGQVTEPLVQPDAALHLEMAE
jgi:integrase